MIIYLRRHGAMVFWRVGKLGGSFYLASKSRLSHADMIERQRRDIAKANRRRNLLALAKIGRRTIARDWQRVPF